MDPLNIPLGWMFVALTAIYSLGLPPHLVSRFYPTSPGFARRSAAPIIFAILAVAYFAGFALQALSVVVVASVMLIAVQRCIYHDTSISNVR